MRYNKLILPIVFALFVFPLAAAGNRAAADPPDAQGFRIQLSDGSLLKGAMSFTMNIDTQYGRLTVSSGNLVSARFDSTSGWADIRTQGVQLRVQYKPDSSDLKAATDLGPVSVDLTKVISIQPLNPQAPNAAPAAASNPYNEASQAPAPTSDVSVQPAPPMDTSPYDYAAPAPYGWPSYYSSEPYAYPYNCPYFASASYCYPFCPWSCFGYGRNFFGHKDRFGGQLAGRGFSSHGGEPARRPNANASGRQRVAISHRAQ